MARFTRAHQGALILGTLALSWLAMQAVHELGHVIAARSSGGRVAEVVLHPATISYTRLHENPSPRLVSWMGPLLGVTLPLIAWAVARWTSWPGAYLLQFFAGFCLMANGAYLSFGSLNKVGDAGDILRHGDSLALLWLFGLITIPLGFWLWNGLGPHFGLGASRGQVDRTAVYVVCAMLLAVVLLELAHEAFAPFN